MKRFSIFELILVAFKGMLILGAAILLFLDYQQHGFRTGSSIRPLMTIIIFSIGLFVLIGLKTKKAEVLFRKKWFGYALAVLLFGCCLALLFSGK